MATSEFPRYRAKPALRLSPSGFLLDGQNGESYTINKTGAFILRALLDGKRSGALWREVAEAFDVNESAARRDTFRFLAELTRIGLLRTDETDEEKAARSAAEDERSDGKDDGKSDGKSDASSVGSPDARSPSAVGSPDTRSPSAVGSPDARSPSAVGSPDTRSPSAQGSSQGSSHGSSQGSSHGSSEVGDA